MNYSSWWRRRGGEEKEKKEEKKNVQWSQWIYFQIFFFFLQMFESSATYPGAYDTQLSTMQPDLIASHRNSHHASHLQFKNHVTQVAQDASESSEIMHRFFKDVPVYKKDANLLPRHLSTKKNNSIIFGQNLGMHEWLLWQKPALPLVHGGWLFWYNETHADILL